MPSKILYSLLTLTILGAGISGCGNNSSAPNEAHHMRQAATTPVNHIGKYAREIAPQAQAAFDVNAIDWEYDNLEGLKIHLSADTLYLQFTHNSQAENIQFFLDIDDDAKTGNKEEGGADYMVENGYLYEATSNNDWGWREIGNVPSVIDAGKSDTIAISLANLHNKSAVFKANAQALDLNWIPQITSPLDGTKSIYSQKNSIDWSKVSTLAKSGDKSLKLFDTKEMLYMQISLAHFPAHTQLYIDADNNAQSGYHDNNWNNFGRDFLIEDGYLYRYTGIGEWGWELVDTIEKVRQKGDKSLLTLTIPKKKLGNITSKIKVAVETNNKDWTQTDFIPQGAVPIYTLQPNNPPHKQDIEISEVMASNAHTILDDDYYNFSDWIELHNTTDRDINIAGYNLSNKLNKKAWTIPNDTVIPADGYLLIWADKKDKKRHALHTNFKLKSKGGAVALFDKEGKTIQSFEYKQQLPDVSITQKEGKIYYMNPTPQKKNLNGFSKAIVATAPTFSQNSGFTEATQVTLSSAQNSQIYYTTDGSIPTTHSTLYRGAIPITQTASIRAISVQKGKLASPVHTETYIVGENNTHMPIIAITIDDKYLHDDMIGIYTIGKNGKEMKDCGPQSNGIIANYMQKWERPAHMVMFEENKKVVLSQDIGLKISGQCSRKYAQKSLQLKADGKYGEKTFHYQVFPDKNIKKYERLKLRNAGQDFRMTHMRDVLAQMLTKGQMHLNYEAYRPAVVFINGQYWGYYALREKMGKEYLEENYHIKKMNFLVDDTLVKEGKSDNYDQLNDFLRTHSLQNAQEYAYVTSRIDIDNYIDYMIANIYIGNADWPGTNLYYWQEAKVGSKWQWLLHDMDYGFDLYEENEKSDVTYNTFNQVTEINNNIDWPNPEWSTLLFRKLLENPAFKQQFKARFEEQLNTTFSPARVNQFITNISDKIKPQIARHIDRWRENGEYSYSVNSLSDWQKEVNRLHTFANNRAKYLRQYLKTL